MSHEYESYDWNIYCGSDVPTIKGMPGHQMELVFQTDGQTQYEGTPRTDDGLIVLSLRRTEADEGPKRTKSVHGCLDRN